MELKRALDLKAGAVKRLTMKTMDEKRGKKKFKLIFTSPGASSCWGSKGAVGLAASRSGEPQGTQGSI